MKRSRSRAALAAALGVVALIASALASSPAHATSRNASWHSQKVCAAASAGHATCFAEVMVSGGRGPDARPRASTPPATATTPADIQSAYRLAGLSSGGKTVAIVDAYGYPNLERDLATYRSYFGLPPCTTASGCLRVVDQTGGTSLPRFDVGWAGEQALDVDAVSAACPDCKILVVQASSTSFADLGAAADTAARQSGVVAISNSYGSDGDAPDSTYGSHYDHPGIAVTASTGDDGYQGGSFPASSTHVTAVGGTTLTSATNSRGWSETAWDGAGSGCSDYNAQPSFQTTSMTGCGRRAMADVAAAADPADGGLAVYWPTNRQSSGWAQVGGTSESSPLIAVVYALGPNPLSGYPNALPYSHTSGLYDITTGSNGSCPTTRWCTAGGGWDGPTGLGTPDGAGAF